MDLEALKRLRCLDCWCPCSLPLGPFARACHLSISTVDEVFEQVIVMDEPVTIGFVARQHGVHVSEGLRLVVSAVHKGDKTTIQAKEALPDDDALSIGLPSSSARAVSSASAQCYRCCPMGDRELRPGPDCLQG